MSRFCSHSISSGSPLAVNSTPETIKCWKIEDSTIFEYPFAWSTELLSRNETLDNSHRMQQRAQHKSRQRPSVIFWWNWDLQNLSTALQKSRSSGPIDPHRLAYDGIYPAPIYTFHFQSPGSPNLNPNCIPNSKTSPSFSRHPPLSCPSYLLAGLPHLIKRRFNAYLRSQPKPLSRNSKPWKPTHLRNSAFIPASAKCSAICQLRQSKNWPINARHSWLGKTGDSPKLKKRSQPFFEIQKSPNPRFARPQNLPF